MATSEKTTAAFDSIEPNNTVASNAPSMKSEIDGSHEVFRDDGEGVNFRSMSWQNATIVFLKIQFAMSILSVPASLATLGAVGGALSIFGWDMLNLYTAIALGDFRNRHPECHTLADMCGYMWGRVGKELCGLQILVAQVLITAGGIVSISTAFNALSNHGACTVWFNFVAAVAITVFSSVRTFTKLGWLTWFGFSTFFIAVFIFVVAVTQQDRPAAAPATGDFDLGFVAMAYPNFSDGITQSLNIFISASGSSMYLPVISEMKRPQDYRKAALVAGFIVFAMYLSFSLVIYAYCGTWLTSPVFGSAGTLFKKISYGISLPGLVIGVGIYQHVAAKYMFVRLLRHSDHLQANTIVHWGTWLGSNLILGILGFIIAEAVPILSYILALAGSLCFAPFSLTYPALLWMYDFKAYRSGTGLQKLAYGFHAFVALLGLFLLVGGTYGAAVLIKAAYDDGQIGGVFQCADNSGYTP